MAEEFPRDLFEVAESGGVTVVRFTRRTILDPATIEAVGQRLTALVRQENCRKLALDFGRVESLTSGMLGKFVALHQSIDSAGGRLVFCAVGPFLMQIFTICGLPGSIPLLANESEAVRVLSEPTGP